MAQNTLDGVAAELVSEQLALDAEGLRLKGETGVEAASAYAARLRAHGQRVADFSGRVLHAFGTPVD